MAGSGPRLEPKIRTRTWPGSETGLAQGLVRGLSQVSGKRTGRGLSLGWGRDWVGWSRQGPDRGRNLGEDRDQVGSAALVKTWPEPGSGQDQGLRQGSEEAGPERSSGPGHGRALFRGQGMN